MSVIRKKSPVTGEELGEFHVSTPEEVEEAVARARKASASWGERSLDERFAVLDRIKQVIEENGEEYARRISEDTGKPLVDSLMTELISVPLFIDHYRRSAKKVLKPEKVWPGVLFPGKKAHIEYFPMGVIAVISPWNFPFQLAMIPVISALIGGNTVVLKPSEVTPITGEVMAEIFDEAGVPDGVVQVLQGDGSTGAALCEADVDKIFFTGSVATGRKVMAEAAKKPIPVELELGGKDAMIVCADANLERAAKGAVWAGLINCGQMCTSVERLFVVDEVYDRFVELLKEEVSSVKVGGPDEEADIGPMTFPPQLETVKDHLDNALESGAKVLHGGERIERDGQFFEPTLVVEVTPDMEIYREESFGPLLPVIRVSDEEEAVRLANAHKYGLNGSIWTSDLKKGKRLASQMECGQVGINDAVLSVGNPKLPFGGVKSSGFGRYHGDEGLLTFMHQKVVWLDKGKSAVEPFWFPYTGKYEYMKEAFHNLLQGKILRAGLTMLKLIRHSKKKA